MTRVKVCGLMNQTDMNLCIQAGVHCLGFVVDFPAPVPWNLSRAKAKELIAETPPFVSTCVVTGGSVEAVMAVAEATCPDLIQLHYQETLEEVRTLAQQLSRLRIKTIKALRINEKGKCAFEITDPVKAAQVLAQAKVAALVVDSYTPSTPGGTGIPVDLSILKKIQRGVSIPVIMAGGLNPDNVGAFIRIASPYAVDVLTGVEEMPGKKDAEKIKSFMQSIASSSSVFPPERLTGETP